MNRPLKEHYEVDSDAGIMVRTFDYIDELEKYCNLIEAERLRCMETKNATVQMLENNFTEYMKSFESHRNDLNAKIISLESQLREKEEHYRKLEVVANRWHNEYLSMSAEKDQELHEKDREIERLKDIIKSKDIIQEDDALLIGDLREALRQAFTIAYNNACYDDELLDRCRKLIGE